MMEVWARNNVSCSSMAEERQSDLEISSPKLVNSLDMVWFLLSLEWWSLKWGSQLLDKMLDKVDI